MDVDYRVMFTFLEFYLVLMKFVNYRLYKEKGWKYPPEQVDEVESNNYFSYKALQLRNQTEETEDSEKFLIDERFKADEEV